MVRKYAPAINGAVTRYRESFANPVLAIVAVLYAVLLGLLNVAQALGHRFSQVASGIVRYMRFATWRDPSAVAILFGVFMLFIAYQLWLRKRAALIVLSAFLILQAGIDIWRGMGIAAGVVSFFIGIALLSAGREFPAKPNPASFKRFKVLLPLLLSAFVCYGVAGLYLMKGSLGISGNAYSLAYRAVTVALGESGLRFQGWAILYRDTLTLFIFLGFTYLTILLFRPYREPAVQRPEDHRRARELMERYGSDSLSYFNLRQDKSLFFYSDKIFLAYRCVGGTAVISGDPVGPSELVPEIMDKFRDYCVERGWRLTCLGSRHEILEQYERAGLKSLCLGEEAVINLPDFSLEGRRVRKLRQSVNRLEKMGVTMEFMFNAGIPAHMKHDLQQISADWRGGKPETGFSMGLGRLMDPEDPDCLLSVAYDSRMRPVGFLYMVPMYPRLGYSLDITRTMIGAQAALPEFMLARTAMFLKEQGYRHMSLHFIAFSQHYREGREELGSKFWRATAGLLDHILPVVSMYNFDRKFFPQWKKRYLIYDSLIDFPRIGVAAVTAESALRLSRQRDTKE